MQRHAAVPMGLLLALAACNGVPTGGSPEAPAELRVVQGADQTVLVGYPADTVVVRVVDRFGRAMPDVMVAITTDPTASALSAATATSDANGEVRLGWRPAVALGAQQLRATIPTAASVPALLVTATTVSNTVQTIAGDASVLCAVTADGRLGCWAPHLGAESAPSLRLVATTERFRSLAMYPSVTTGAQHGCASATGGRLWCFAVDGDGVVTNLAEVPGTYPALASLSAVHDEGVVPFMCGLAGDGHAWCWGDNRSGNLGDGTTINRDAPVPVDSPVAFESLTVGSKIVCGLDHDRAAWCWGNNPDGQLGLPAEPDPVVRPTAIPTDLRFRSLTVIDEDGVCGVPYAGGVWCWGARYVLGGSPQPRQVTGIAPKAVTTVGLAVVALDGPRNATWWGITGISIIPGSPLPLDNFPEFTGLVAGTGRGLVCGFVADPTQPYCVRFNPLQFLSDGGFGVPFPEGEGP